jgi:hypothetical protein
MGLRFARQVTLSGSMWDGLQALGARHLFTWRFFHLWFLADLLLFYGLALTVRWLIGQLALERRERLSKTCRTLLRSSWHSAIFAIPTAALLLPIHLDRADLTTGLLLQVLLLCCSGSESFCMRSAIFSAHGRGTLGDKLFSRWRSCRLHFGARGDTAL